MESYTLFFILIGILVVATVSNRIRNTITILPMIYTLFGLLVVALFTLLLALQFTFYLIGVRKRDRFGERRTPELHR